MLKKLLILSIALFLYKFNFAQSTSSRSWYLLFWAREASLKPFSLAGHAFVSWGFDTVGQGKISLPLTLGFYPDPKSDIVEEITDHKRGKLVAGWFKNSNNRKSLITIVLKIDSTTWARTQLAASAWHLKSYNLLDRNCVKFMDAVAESVPLRTPRVQMILGFPRRPTNYLRRLGRKNKADIFYKTTHFFRKTQKGEEKIPIFIDLEELRNTEESPKNGKTTGQ